MNERIKQLESQAWGQVNRTNGLVRTEDFNKKFAELIVKECMSIVSKSGNSKAEVLNDLEEFIWGKK